MSVLMSRFGISKWLGKMFNGHRDLYQVFGYDRNITYEKTVGRYQRQDITSRIVDAPADALWATPPILTSDNAEWNRIWAELTTQRRLWSAIGRVDRMAAMGEYAVLLLGFDKGSDLSRPASKAEGRKVLYFQPYSLPAATIKTLTDNPADPRYMKPELYTIRPGQDPMDANMSKTAQSAIKALRDFDVHHSRILHVAENYLQDEVFGNPRLFRVYNLLDDVLKVAGGTAETFWLTANRGMQVDVDKEMELTPEDAKDLNDEIEEYVNQLRRVMRTRGVKITNLGSDIPDPKSAFEILLSLISGATGIPKRILLGSEAGQLASTEDRNNWADRVTERRKNFGEPVVLYPLVASLTQAGVLPEANVKVTWPDAFTTSPLERAQTTAQTARTAANLAKAMTEQPTLIKGNEARKILGLDPEPDANITPEEDAK